MVDRELLGKALNVAKNVLHISTRCVYQMWVCWCHRLTGWVCWWQEGLRVDDPGLQEDRTNQLSADVRIWIKDEFYLMTTFETFQGQPSSHFVHRGCTTVPIMHAICAPNRPDPGRHDIRVGVRCLRRCRCHCRRRRRPTDSDPGRYTACRQSSGGQQTRNPGTGAPSFNPLIRQYIHPVTGTDL